MQQSRVELRSDRASRPYLLGGGGERAAGKAESQELPSNVGGAAAPPGDSESPLPADGTL